MTRNHFVKIAATLKATKHLYRSEKAYREAVGEFVQTLYCMNDNFDPDKFDEACGINDCRVTTKPQLQVNGR